MGSVASSSTRPAMVLGAAIDHNALPRIHPRLEDRLEFGMVFNVEPAIYLDGIEGLRHCDMVAVTDSGVELLTPFHSSLEQLTLQPRLHPAST